MYSKYIDNSKKENGTFLSLEEITENILNYSEWMRMQEDPLTGEKLKYEVVKEFEENQQINIKGTVINYNCLRYSYESVMYEQSTNPIAAERLRTTSGKVIIYSDGIRTQYIIDRARGNSALRILRILNNSDRNKTIEALPLKFDEELFIWLISKFMGDNKILDENNSLSVNKIIGFKGEGNQNQAVLSGAGNEILNLFSSIFFLIEMDVMTEVEAKFDIGHESFGIRFFSTNSQIDISFDKYSGDHLLDLNEIKEPIIILKSFMELLPSVIDSYSEAVDNGDWNDAIKKEFINGLGESVMESIKQLYT